MSMSVAEELVREFQNPGAAWRGKPFWSWNGRLDEAELLRQVRVLQEMGFGGFFMHSRTGLVTEYLGDEWFRLINACADEAERRGMEAWLYDEDRWPSGSAGGLVTENPAHRARFLSLQAIPGSEFQWQGDIIAAFACHLEGEDGTVFQNAVRIGPDSPDSEFLGHTILVFTLEEQERSSFYNGFTYLDTLSRDATDAFIQSTHEQYQAHSGDRFNKSIQGIFTDEPHRGPVLSGFSLSNENRRWMAPWTSDLPRVFYEQFGYDLVEHLPELFLRNEGQSVSQVKWHYMELLQQLFLANFARPLYDWCDSHNLRLTGHVLHEDSLTAQAAMQGSLMRFYEFMHDPGVDVLTEGNRCYWIVKQLTSVARQTGKTWLLSELYGCTGWQMDFQAHKAVGDWQALFGINLRCHHLSWYSMAGEAKRDYPASILHQSAWWQDYEYVETYFSRLGLLLSAGMPCCDLLVLNPVESVWCQIRAGWADGLSPQTPEVQALEKAYREIFHGLAGAHLDFDYADEEMLGRLGQVEKDVEGVPVVRVGEMTYRAVLIAGMATMRGTTLSLLAEFLAAGGRVVFAGASPTYINAVPSPDAATLAQKAVHVPWDMATVASACRSSVQFPMQITGSDSDTSLPEVFCQLRRWEDGSFLLAAINTSVDQAFDSAKVRVDAPGISGVERWDCRTGERWNVPCVLVSDGRGVEFNCDFSISGENVFVLRGAETATLPSAPIVPHLETVRETAFAGPYTFTLGEPNVCVLDRARWRLGDGTWQGPREILKVDQDIRDALNLPRRGGEMVQPWYRRRVEGEALETPLASLALAFEFDVAELPTDECFLCVEQPERWQIRLNDIPISSETPGDWWVDVAFPKLKLPLDALKPGRNTLTLETALTPAIDLEAIYLLGKFGVYTNGPEVALGCLPDTLTVGSVTTQGLPFYGGIITYHLALPADPTRDVGQNVLVTPAFEGALAKVTPYGGPCRYMAFAPYEVDIIGMLGPEEIVLPLEVVLTRRNTFGPLHQIPLRAPAYGPPNWLTQRKGFSDDFQFYPAGLLEPPILRWVKGESNA